MSQSKRTDDKELIRQFQSGHIHAFNSLAERWHKPLHRFAQRFFADEDQAADVAQQTLIRAYQKLNQLEKPETFSAWIYRIAKNLCIDQKRKNGRDRLASYDELKSAESTADNTQPERVVEKSELGRLVEKALLAIPAEQRAVIILKEFEGLKFREIAEVMQEPENTVKSRMYYGLKALRKVFKTWNIEKEVLYDG